MSVAVGGLDLEHALADVEHRDVEGAAAEVEDRDAQVLARGLLVEAEGERRGGVERRAWAQIAQEAADWLDQPERLEGMRADLRSLRGRPGAVAALAGMVRELLPPQTPGPA